MISELRQYHVPHVNRYRYSSISELEQKTKTGTDTEIRLMRGGVSELKG